MMDALVAHHGMTIMYGCFWSLVGIVGVFFAQAEALILKERRAPKYFLSQNYPNPFNLTTTISYSLQTGSRITLKIYDMLDRGVATLAIGTQSEGNYIVTFDGSKLASGVYLYRLDALGMNGEQFTDTKRMVLIK